MLSTYKGKMSKIHTHYLTTFRGLNSYSLLAISIFFKLEDQG